MSKNIYVYSTLGKLWATLKVQSAIDTLENKKGNKTPVKPTATSQAKKASATTVPITKYKQGLSTGVPRK